jgi:hypothetical protein
MVKDGIMNLVTGIWAEIKELIKGENKMEKKPNKKYMVMSKFKHSDRFNLEKQFVNRHSADAYVDLMIEDKEYDNIEQSHDYQHTEENPMKDFEEVLHGNG